MSEWGVVHFRTDLFGFLGFLRFKDLEDERDGLIGDFRIFIDEDIGFARDGLAERDPEHACGDRPHFARELRQRLGGLRAAVDRRTVFAA